MKINYCLPVIQNTKEEVMASIQQNKNEYQYVEIWLDYITDLDIDFVKGLAKVLDEKLILLFRRQQLEEIRMDIQQRKDIISLLENTNVLLDLDIQIQQEELDFIQEGQMNIHILCSYHNYEQTLITDEINKIITDMEYYNPAVYKIATFCQTENDAVLLLQTLLTLKQQEKKYIVLGMGEKGSITRIYGTLWGNEMIFAPKEKDKLSAPGQLTKSELERIFSTLNV